MKRELTTSSGLSVSGAALFLLPILICFIIVALARSDVIAVDPPTMNAIAYGVALPISLLGLALGAIGLHIARAERALAAVGLHIARAERDPILRKYMRSVWKEEQPIEIDGVIRMNGDFNNLITRDHVLLNTLGSLRDLERLGRKLRSGLRVVINDGSYEAEGVLEFDGEYWRARILWETGRDTEPEDE